MNKRRKFEIGSNVIDNTTTSYNKPHSCAISLCNISLSRLYNSMKITEDTKELEKMCRNTFFSLRTIPDSVSYEVEEFIRFSIRYRFIYMSLRKFQIFVESGLDVYFDNLDYSKHYPAFDDIRILSKRCVCLTLCSSLDRSCFKMIGNGVIDFILGLCSEHGYENFPWIIHATEMASKNHHHKKNVPVNWEPSGEIDFFLNEKREKEKLRNNVNVMQVCGRAMDNDLGIKTSGHQKRILELESSEGKWAKNEPEYDKAWLGSRNKDLYKPGIGDYLDLITEDGKPLKRETVFENVNWMKSNSERK